MVMKMKIEEIEKIVFNSGSLYCPIYGVSQNDSHIYIFLHEEEKLGVNELQYIKDMEMEIEADFQGIDVTEDYTITEKGKEDNCIDEYTKLPNEVIVLIFEKW